MHHLAPGEHSCTCRTYELVQAVYRAATSRPRRSAVPSASHAGFAVLPQRNAVDRNGSYRRLQRFVPILGALAAIGVLGMPLDTIGQEIPVATATNAAHEVKAAFLFYFASYVEWPPSARSTVSFALLNAPDVELEFERFASGRTIHGKPISVRHLDTIDDLRDDDVLFIGSRENSRLPELIQAIDGATLIVSDAPDGLSAGAMVNFLLVDQRVRFEISVPAAEAAGLVLSSRLLSAALHVQTSRCGIECRQRNPVPATRELDATQPGSPRSSASSSALRAWSEGRTRSPRYFATTCATCAPNKKINAA